MPKHSHQKDKPGAGPLEALAGRSEKNGGPIQIDTTFYRTYHIGSISIKLETMIMNQRTDVIIIEKPGWSTNELLYWNRIARGEEQISPDITFENFDPYFVSILQNLAQNPHPQRQIIFIDAPTTGVKHPYDNVLQEVSANAVTSLISTQSNSLDELLIQEIRGIHATGQFMANRDRLMIQGLEARIEEIAATISAACQKNTRSKSNIAIIMGAGHVNFGKLLKQSAQNGKLKGIVIHEEFDAENTMPPNPEGDLVIASQTRKLDPVKDRDSLIRAYFFSRIFSILDPDGPVASHIRPHIQNQNLLLQTSLSRDRSGKLIEFVVNLCNSFSLEEIVTIIETRTATPLLQTLEPIIWSRIGELNDRDSRGDRYAELRSQFAYLKSHR